MGWENSMSLQPYCPRFRAYRKAVHRALGSNVAIARFNQLQDAEVRRFLLRVLERPDDLVQHIRTYEQLFKVPGRTLTGAVKPEL